MDPGIAVVGVNGLGVTSDGVARVESAMAGRVSDGVVKAESAVDWEVNAPGSGVGMTELSAPATPLVKLSMVAARPVTIVAR